jgi:aldehyde dehydrogenase (NAD+)
MDDLLRRFGFMEDELNPAGAAEGWGGDGPALDAVDPASGETVAQITGAGRESFERAINTAQAAFESWRTTPAPSRGELVRLLGAKLRERKADLGELVSFESGKILSEGLGEVQEMIDICDFAAGLSRQLCGLTIASERPRHRLIEQWHPLGIVGVISAFNFPVAVWSWNAALAAVAGDAVVWKPSERTPLSAIAVHRICREVEKDAGAPPIFQLLIGDASIGAALAADKRVPLVSATGSCAMGRKVAATVAHRLGKTLLELGGNNAAILAPSADLDLAIRAIVFAAAGTAGQRCTTLRRLIVHESLAESVTARLAKIYAGIKVGDPRAEGVLVGPLIRESAVTAFEEAVRQALAQGGRIVCGGKRVARQGFFVEPTIVRARAGMPIVAEETFAPILYVIAYRTLEEAIAINNGVSQGLSSAIFSNDLRETEAFLAATGSDCGLANVNAGTSGAEIGGAFGGEKDTGGGRESGSDSWKAYMRRQTCTINGGSSLPLAQGVRFEVDE